MTARLSGRKAVVTGGANGLGAATAELFAAEGATVVVADLERAADAGAELVARIGAAGGTAHFLPVDVRDADGTVAMVDRAAELMGASTRSSPRPASVRRRRRTARCAGSSTSMLPATTS